MASVVSTRDAPRSEGSHTKPDSLAVALLFPLRPSTPSSSKTVCVLAHNLKLPRGRVDITNGLTAPVRILILAAPSPAHGHPFDLFCSLSTIFCHLVPDDICELLKSPTSTPRILLCLQAEHDMTKRHVSASCFERALHLVPALLSHTMSAFLWKERQKSHSLPFRSHPNAPLLFDHTSYFFFVGLLYSSCSVFAFILLLHFSLPLDCNASCMNAHFMAHPYSPCAPLAMLSC